MKAIAIVSAGLRFPKARTLDEYWDLLNEGRDVSSSFPEWLRADPVSHDRAYRIEDWRESALGLNLDPDDLERLDPLFHIAIGAGRDAFFGSRFERVRRDRVSIILGNIALPTDSSAAAALRWLQNKKDDGHAWNLSPASLPAHVLAMALNISGPRFTLDAACASSLYALKLACDELIEGRAEMVLAGGLSRPDGLYTQVGFTALEALSRSGHCYSLDSRADGLMVGEGAGIFGLKRLEEAEAHGDQILGVIRAVGLSNDRDGGLMAPSSEGQLRAMRAAYQEARWAADSVSLIECHATGTPLGDTIEFQSLCQLWEGANGKAVIGSVKPNVGHMLTAAGSAGVAKLLLAMKKARIPPTANFQKAPKSWSIETSPFEILQSSRDWPSDSPRRAAISGFGFGGINAHLLLEEYRKDQTYSKSEEKNNGRAVHLVAASHLKGRWDQGFELGYKQFRIPPNEIKDILPQQVLALLAADALEKKSCSDAERMGCFVGLELDPTTNLFSCRWRGGYAVPPLQANRVMGALGSIVASRLAREMNLGGPSFTVAAQEASGLRALELAVRAILRGEMSSALVLAVEMESSPLAENQVEARLGNIWSERDDASVALLLVDAEQSEGRPVLARFDAGSFGNDHPIGAQTWVEDVARDKEFLDELLPSRIQLIETNAYQGASHGLASLLAVPEGSSHLLFRDAVGYVTSVYWEQKTGEVQRKARHLTPNFSVPRWDLIPRTMLKGAKEARRSDEAATNEARRGHETATNGAHRNDEMGAKDSRHEIGGAKESRPSPATAAQDSSAPLEPNTSLASFLITQELKTIQAHQQFLSYRNEGDQLVHELLIQSADPASERRGDDESYALPSETLRDESFVQPSETLRDESFDLSSEALSPAADKEKPLFDYEACREFAVGLIQNVFGAEFAEVDSFPTRVRLPADRLQLCHRVMSIDGEKLSMSSAVMVTEHDVVSNAWYLDDGFMPTAIAVESGQADLMLSAYLGADFKTRGQAVYRLLDARVCFHGTLPKIGETIRYTIQIKRFFEQNGILFFHFAFEASIDDRPLMTMTDGCAGFFSEKALAEGRGVQRSQLQAKGGEGRLTGGYQPLVPMQKESYDDAQIDALRRGDYAACFGRAFADLSLQDPKGLPAGDMRLVHRIPEIDPKGGRFGIGRILGEADIHPDDWFLTCHFVDDQVMPGTLMYECCLHTLRVFLLRAGWVGERADLNYQPIIGRYSQLKCRGQVLASTKTVRYEIELKEIGYGPEPYVICDALMYADGKAIVDIVDMTLSLPGRSRESMEAVWKNKKIQSEPEKAKQAAYGYEQILAFSNGNPSDCFGDVYRVFDNERKIARLPRPPFQFLDRVEWVKGPLMQQNVGTRLLASYDLPDDAWYWACNQGRLPFSVLVEIALQPCGFMAAYMGSALLSARDLKFRNLSGEAVMLQDIRVGSGPLSIEVECLKVARTGDMIIQDYSFRVFNAKGTVYEGTTSFGFFTEEALNQQAGLRQDKAWSYSFAAEPYPTSPALPSAPLCMVDTWGYAADRICGEKDVNPAEWFFQAHFYEDPVMPGSLGLESLMQVLEAEASARNPEAKAWRVALGKRHQWIYRGQVRPKDKKVNLALTIKDDAPLKADGILYCDNLPIYRLENLEIEEAAR